MIVAAVGAVGGYIARRPIEQAGVKAVAEDAVKNLLSAQDTALKRQDSVLAVVTAALDECEHERREDRDNFERRIDQLRGEIGELKQLQVSATRLANPQGDGI